MEDQPRRAGTTKMTALLDGQSADMAIIMLGDGDIASNHPGVPAGRLKCPIRFRSGRAKRNDPGVNRSGGGQPLTPVEATVTAPDGQGIVTANGNKVTGQSVGEAKVTVSAGGQTATVDVRVTAADSLAFNQSEYVLQAGQPATPAVMATGPDGQSKGRPGPDREHGQECRGRRSGRAGPICCPLPGADAVSCRLPRQGGRLPR